MLLKSLTNTFILSIATLAIVSCVPKATESKAVCGENQAFNKVSRSCYSIVEVRVKPVGTKSTDTVLEEKPQLITLTYTDGNKDKALSCKVSGISSSIEVISPFISNNGLFDKMDEVYQAFVDVNMAMPAASSAASATSVTNILNAIALAKTTVSFPVLNAQLAIIKSEATNIFGLAALYPLDTTLQSYVTAATEIMAGYTPIAQQTTDRCECSAGICTTLVVPKTNKSGSAGFTYTVTDVDGESNPKAVSLTITPMVRTAQHLLPTGESSYTVLAESATSVAAGYTITIPAAIDPIGTLANAFQYTPVALPAKGTLTNCMSLTGSTGLNDTTCTYTPTSGDANDTVAVTNASATIGDLIFTAKNPGSAGNNYTVQILDIHADNSVVDSYVTPIEAFGMALSAYNESFVRVQGNAIKIFINPNITTTDDVVNLLAANIQANKLITAVATMTSFPTATATIPLNTTIIGTDAFDTFTYKVSNGVASSVNNKVMIKMTPVNDTPMIPRNYITLFSQTETMKEEDINKAVTFNYRDVDSQSTNFTIDTKIEDVACTGNVLDAYFNAIGPSANLSIAATTVGPVTCSAAGDCAIAINLTANLDFNGSACLYYRVTDSSGAVSAIEKINIVVTDVNDTPLLSSVVIPVPTTPLSAPVTTPLVATAILEDLDSGLSYKTFYSAPGGNGFEDSQILTFTATSDNTTLIPNTVCKNYTLAAGSPVGSIIPAAAGLFYLDSTNLRCYVSTGTTSNTDWKLNPSLTVIPKRNYNNYGQGSPIGVVAVSAAGQYFLDTTNNKSYISYEIVTGVFEWKADTKASGLSSFDVVFVPNKDKSGTANIKIKVQDNGGVLNSAIDFLENTFVLTVTFVNDPPYFDTTVPTAIHTNEGGAVQSDAFYVNEDEGDTADEDPQQLSISLIETDNTSVLPLSAIKIFYDMNDNGVEDALEARTVGAVLDAGTINGHLHAFYLKLDPVDGVSGNANVKVTVSDNYSTPQTKMTQFSFIVHPVAALHGGWNNISSVGIKTDKSGTPVSEAELKCNYNKVADTNQCGNSDCTGVSSPHSVIVPDAANVLFWDSSSKRCYRSTSTSEYSWVEFNTSCPVTRETALCSGENCITNTSPVASITPTKAGVYYYNTSNNTCYVSTDKTSNTDWQVYVPSKVTLAWKPFIMVGSGASSGAQIAGWNVYRREAGADYNFKNGHLKDTNSTNVASIVNPTIRTFTDTTAIAGKVYYYVVRPIDSLRLFPTYTPEIFTEVRVLASPANYSFVHRWMVNQEICNGMKITTATTPNHVDQTKNFRCEYKGPGESPTGYYDYGKDLLVDSNELGCPYAVAPKCSANGCVGIGAPVSSTNVVANDLYYDRSTGSCYSYDGASWATVEATASMAAVTTLNTALNPPLVNVTQAKAAAICSVKANPATGATLGTATLPSKKDYNAYASHPIDLEAGDITDIEQGLSLNISSRCNGSQASGLTTAFTDSTIPVTSFNYAITGTGTSGIRSIYTGSIPWGLNKGTEACVSRFGVQDIYGNVAEWTTDKMDCTSPYVCTSAGTTASYSTYDFGTSNFYAFDYKSGPYNDSNGDGLVGAGDSFLTSWTYSSASFNANKFSYPIGLPINGDIDNSYASSPALDWILDIGPSSGIIQEDLHEDGMIVNGAAVNAGTSKKGSFAVGGSYTNGQMSGRFTAELIPDAVSRKDVGMRCIVPISSTTGYPADAAHVYPY
jgi:hypothetical protein